MVIPENPWQQRSPPTRGPSFPPPPPYTSHQSTTHYVVAATCSPPQAPQVSAGRRFIRAFLVAMLIWLLTGTLVSTSLDMFGIISPVSVWCPSVHVTFCDV